MPSLNFGEAEYHQYSISDWTGGTCTNPIKPNQHFLLYNLMIRTDGKLCSRGTVFEMSTPSAIQNATTTPIDNLVNNQGGPVASAETPYLFWVQNHPMSGQLELWQVTHTGASQTMAAIGNTNNSSLVNPTLPSYTWAVNTGGLPQFLFANWNGMGDDNLWIWNGTSLTDVTSSPPAAQSMLGFTSQAVIAGGGSINGSISLRNELFWSSPNSLTSWPPTQFTNPFVEKGIALMDMTVTNSRPILITNVSFLSLNGDASAFTAVEVGSVQDLLLKNTLGTSGTVPWCAGKNGVYALGDKISDMTLPIKGIYFPVTHGYGTNADGFKAGWGSFSTNGYFYGVYNQTPTPGTLISNMPIPHTTNETSIVLVYDTNFKCWYYWGYEFTIKGITAMDPNALNVTTSANTFITGFAFSGISPTNKNALYFSESSGTSGSDTTDAVTSNYKVGFVSGPLDFGAGNCLKHIGGMTLIGTTSGSAEVIIQGCDSLKIYDRIKVADNSILNLDIDVSEPIRICFSDDSRCKEIQEFNVYYKIIVPELVGA